MATLAGEIKKRSEKMMFSVVVDFEQLSDFLAKSKKLIFGSKAVIVTSQKIEASDWLISEVKFNRCTHFYVMGTLVIFIFVFLQRGNLLWVTMSDLGNTSTEWNLFSSASLSFSLFERNPCGSIVTAGVITVSEPCS